MENFLRRERLVVTGVIGAAVEEVKSWHRWRVGLAILTVIYLPMSVLLLAVSTFHRSSTHVASLPLLSGLQACGGVLLGAVVLGALAVVRRSRPAAIADVALLAAIAAAQIAVAAACFATAGNDAEGIAHRGWNDSLLWQRFDAERAFGCCGYTQYVSEAVACSQIEACGQEADITCPTCKAAVEVAVRGAFVKNGIVAIFVALTEIAGVIAGLFYQKSVR